MQIPVIISKQEFNNLLNETLIETDELRKRFAEILMYENLYKQLGALKNLLIEQKLTLSKDYIYDNFTIGAIATKNFEYEHEIYAQKLMRIFGTSLRYGELN
jgi:hypothetical protein